MQRALTGYDSVYMARSFPLAGGRTEGKEPHDGKKSSHTNITETRADFCVHAALGRLRFVSGSTAQLLYLIDFSISGTGVRVKACRTKSVRVGVKNALQKGWGLRFERIASTASVCTLAEKWRSSKQYRTPFFYFGSLPNPYDCLPAKADGAGNGGVHAPFILTVD